MNKIPIFQVDAFTHKAFSGNPAAVCILQQPMNDRWMQDVAGEMNLSETAFLLKEEGGFNLRWFTPKIEVDLCGHATLAGAHVLWEQGYVAAEDTLHFHTLSGLLSASRRGDWIELDFPSEPPEEAQAPAGLMEVLGVRPKFIGRNRFAFLVEVESEEAVKGLEPDFRQLEKATDQCLIVTAPAESAEYDFVSRFFAPAGGIDEDPVTGSAHCCLGPFWGAKLGKKEMIAFQASARGGVVRVRLGDQRVFLSGQAVTVLRGELTEN